MNQEKYIKLIAQYLTGEISENNREVLLAWVEAGDENRIIFEETVQLWAVSENYKSDFDTNVEEAWSQVEQKIVTKSLPDSSVKIIGLSNFKRFLQVAAVFLIGAVGLYFLLQKNPTPQLVAYQTQEEETLKVMLPDSSQIVLNENSQLTYTKVDGKRLVTLEGEAWFDVQHMDDITFEIQTGDARTVVVGTAFNVRAYPNEAKVEVSVARGKVAFSKKNDLESVKILPAGTEGVFLKKEKKVVKVKRENDNANAWRTLTLDFDHVKIEKVFETLERYFEVKIESDANILKCDFKGVYKNPKLENVLDAIEFALGAKITKKNKTYIFSGEGCEE